MSASDLDFLLPIDSLHVEGTWDLRVLRLLDRSAVVELLRLHPAAVPESDSKSEVDDFLQRAVGCVAHVRAPSIEDALARLTNVVEVLRVFQQANTTCATTMFGLDGDLRQSRIDYLLMADSAVASGWRIRGHHGGWTYNAVEQAKFNESAGFQQALMGIAADEPTEGQRRALLGISLASQAILETHQANRLLLTMMAAEVLLLERSTTTQSWRLARRSAYFLCGDHDGDLCGRARPTCPALACDPDTKAGRKAAGVFRERGNTDLRWRCSEWHHVLDRYDARSDVVHGGELLDDDDGVADKAVFWLLTRLVPALLDWFVHHPDHPVADLDDAISDLPAAPDWERLITEARHQARS